MPKFSLHTKRSRIQKLIAEFEQGNTPQARDVALVPTKSTDTDNLDGDARWIKQKGINLAQIFASFCWSS